MINRFPRSVLVAVMSAATALVSVPAATASVPAPPRIVAHFDLAAGQTAENLVVEPDGSTDVSFAMANQVAHVTRDGRATILAQLPSGGKCAIFPGPATLGLARAHDGTLYVAECTGDGSAGPIDPVVTGLTGGLDDFAVVGHDNTIIAALNMADEVIQVKPGGRPRVLLTGADGLSTPTSVRVHHDTMYVTSAAYFTGIDPNLLVAPLKREHAG